MNFKLSLPKVVIDTNIWISAIFWGGKPRQAIETWINNKVSLIVSPPLHQEFFEAISQKAKVLNLAPNFALKWFKIIDQGAILVHPKSKKDNLLLEACLEGNADYLVTGDKDLLVLKTFKTTRILAPAQFLKLI
ncbi:putative toxin-antitoxin system toxin component, PIN family [Candidatus Gottesmanbacteria bacterium]|nr:putative toxin-antitoxin system toxin component, PIN family [Candidatus Gottesmanbacteria bacterium]